MTDLITQSEAVAGAFRTTASGALPHLGFKKATVSVNPGSIAATSKLAVAVTVTGVKAGDMVVVEPPAALEDDVLLVGWRVTADDTVTVYLYNPTAGSIDPAAANWDFYWADLTA